jgi:hypothetical protein
MFIGHYAAALAAKKVAPTCSCGRHPLGARVVGLGLFSHWVLDFMEIGLYLTGAVLYLRATRGARPRGRPARSRPGAVPPPAPSGHVL